MSEVNDAQRIRFARPRRRAEREECAMSTAVARSVEQVTCRDQAAFDAALAAQFPHIALCGSGRFGLSLLGNTAYPLIEVCDDVRLSLGLADAAAVRLVLSDRASVSLRLSDAARAEVDVRDGAALEVSAADGTDFTVRAHDRSALNARLTGEARGYCYSLDRSRGTVTARDSSHVTVRGWDHAAVGLLAEGEACAYVNAGGNTRVSIRARTRGFDRKSVHVERYGRAVIDVRAGERRVSIEGRLTRARGTGVDDARESAER
jgi:hypothetical protein